MIASGTNPHNEIEQLVLIHFAMSVGSKLEIDR
ncbi:MAG: hypothetical protein ACJATI_004585 [Halioglobus sp.]|jgi:hypothetical protein